MDWRYVARGASGALVAASAGWFVARPFYVDASVNFERSSQEVWHGSPRWHDICDEISSSGIFLGGVGFAATFLRSRRQESRNYRPYRA